MKIRFKPLIVLFLSILYASVTTGAIDLNMKEGISWSASVGLTDLTGGPGSDFTPDLESIADYTKFDIRKANGLYYEVDVKKTDTSWDSHLHFYVRVSSYINGPISGGSFYQEVTDSYQYFFNGTNDADVYLQLKFGQVSALIPVGTYSTTVTYYVFET